MVAPGKERVAQDEHGEFARLPDGRPVVRIADVLRANAAATPDAPAIIEADSVTSFAALDRLANRVANALARDGVRPGDRVAFLGSNSPAFLAVLYGAAKMGAIPTALNNRLAPAEISHILADAQPSVVVMGAGDDQHLPAAATTVGLLRLVTGGDASEQTGATAWADWLLDVATTDPGVRQDVDDTAVIFYTSGTTGPAKGIELTGRNIGIALSPLQQTIKLDRSSVATAPIPFFHIAGIGLALVATLNGSALLLESAASLPDLVELWQRHRVSHAVVVPAVLQVLINVPGVAGADFSALKYLIYGAAPIPVPVLTRATEIFGCSFVQSYGLTESTGGITILTPQDHRPAPGLEKRLQSVGRPLPGSQVRIVDPVTMEELPAGQRGEVLIGGDLVMKGYWRRPEATLATILPGGWLRTGDGGSLDADGYLFLHDRIKDMIVSGAENIYPAEVESVLSGHPDVAEIAVVGVPSQRWGESPFAIAVARTGSEPSAQEIITWARERLAHFKCPVGVRFVDALPRTASGKIRKADLRRQLAATPPA
ncbi:long-chain-fatty-acid--CoA ligase [Nakamurella sp. PAMC28650]|uniref:long-chain-fatty-acid--CoA ligase n=1 Tax=Nakamurella sp. PAMC28650 TaxID=2762325 RepID=UPI00164D9F93|nr:long-chain-fatty-acid--CoA ligase [Nakamurella sp. PAMC28650]QNK82501.1 long-chain-fatty-acid--CoA ligase [Nakamurella sp. PAMC28650]